LKALDLKTLALAVLLAASASAHAQMYKCVDERGVTSYSDKPRPGCKGKEVDIRPIPPVSGQAVKPGRSDVAGEEAEFRRRQIERGQAEAQDVAVRKNECELLRREYARLQFPGRLAVSIDAKGERVYIDDDTRQKRSAEIRDKLGACP
jgi:Domain of unknown function (DUF4124)